MTFGRDVKRAAIVAMAALALSWVAASPAEDAKAQRDALFQQGLDALQRDKDPERALEILEKVPLPEVRPPVPTCRDAELDRARLDYEVALHDWYSVHSLMAKCEIRLGRPADASARYAKLGQLFPASRPVGTFERDLDREVRSALTDDTLAGFHPVYNAWLAANDAKKAMAEENPWGKESNGVRCALALPVPELRVGDAFSFDVRLRNVSDEPLQVYYPSVFPALNLVIRDEKGEVVKCVRAGFDYNMPNPKDELRLIKPGEVFSAKIAGRVAYVFKRAADLKGDAGERPVTLDFHDVMCELARLGRFTASLRLAADEKTVAMGKGVEGKIWTGDLTSNVVEFSVRPMTRAELDGFVEVLKAGDDARKREAIDVLAANCDRKAVSALMAILSAGAEPNLRAASDALVRIQDASILPDLLALYRMSVKYPKRDAGGAQSILLLTVMGLEADRAKLNDLLVEVLKSDASVEARSTAAWQLAMTRDAKTTSALIDAAKKPEPRMQYAAIDALASVGANTAPADKGKISAPLVEILKSDPEANVRSRAASALGMVRDKSVVLALVEALKDKDPFVGSYAVHSLSTLAGPEVIPAIEAWSASVDTPDLKDAAMRAIGTIRQRAGMKP
jgi:HEAT repeat protein